MSDWSSGYVADIGYTYGYYFELNPLRAKLALLNNGLVCPEINTACELGFGQGLSANIHAASSNIDWYGTDFNPEQAGFAQELALASGTSAKLLDESFEDYFSRADLPDFDFIALHGIWSWISNDNRETIVEFIRKKLKVGGVLYISYNTLPGWSTFAPIRHLLALHSEVIGAAGHGIVNRIDEALGFANRLFESNPAYLTANPAIKERLDGIKDQNRHYLAHEYFNRDWDPMYFTTLAEWLAPAKIDFACSANYLDQIDVVNMTKEQQEFLTQIPDPVLKQSVRDFMTNQQFRKDYWVKGPRRLSALEQFERLQKIKVILCDKREKVSLKVRGALGEATLEQSIYEPILDVMADNKPITIADLQKKLASTEMTFPQIVEALIVLSSSGTVAEAQEESKIKKAKQQTKKINSYLIDRSRSRGDAGFLASPVTGGGIPVGRFQQLFLDAFQKGHKTPEEMSNSVWELLKLQNQRILQDGKTLESDEENLKHLIELAATFLREQKPVLDALDIS